MLNTSDILSTLQMIDSQKLDVRTITMGISLLECVTDDEQKLYTRVYDRISKQAAHLVETGCAIEREYGVPIVHKRISVTPAALITGGVAHPEIVARAMDAAAKNVGVNFIGGYSALVHKAMTAADERLIRSIPQALAETDLVCSSINIGSTRAGINMDAVRLMGDIVKQTAAATEDRDGLGCAKLVVFCNAVEDNPFMAGAFHGPGEGDCAVSVGVSGPGVVKVALEASRRLNVPFGIVDLSLAPTPEVGDCVEQILEEMGLERCGTHGTTAALALLNDAVKKGGVMASSNVGGLSGAFIPLSEDAGMIEAAEVGALCIEKLEAMTCVCSVGLDMIAVPGDTPAETIAAVIADEAAIGMINNKTTAVRLIPVPHKKVGDHVEFGGLLGHAPVIALNGYSAAEFIHRGGRIPAPLHSLKN